MLPFDAPAGTTPAAYVRDLVPAAHRTHVPAQAASKTFSVAVSVGEVAAVTYRVRGSDIDVDDELDRAHVVLSLRAGDVERFLADFAGPRRWVPTRLPDGPKVATDPRILERVSQVSGSLTVAVPDFPGGEVLLKVAAFSGRLAHGDDDRETDARVALTTAVLADLLAARLSPDRALAADGVALSGKRLVAMQFALAMAPFFPVR